MKKKDRFSINVLLSISYLLIIGMAFGTGLMISNYMESMRNITHDLYSHPFAVSNASKEIKISIFQLRVHMLKALVTNFNINDFNKWKEETDLIQENINEKLIIVDKNFLGDMQKVRQLEMRLSEWSELRKMIFDLHKNKDYKKAEKLIKEDVTNKLNEIIPIVDYIIGFAKNEAKGYPSEAENSMQTKILNVHLLLGFLICFVILIGLFTINHISKLMLEKNNVVQQLKVREDQLRLQLDNMNIAQRQLAQSESQFRQLAENIEHVLWLASIDKIIYVSPSIEKVFGLKQEDIYLDGTVFMKNIFYEDKESIKNAFQNANINHLDINEEYRILHPEKGLRWIWVRTFNLKNVGFEESKVVGIAQDITDRKIFEEQMLVSLDREMELNKLKSNIVSLVSHQFRTPLTTIKSSIQILASYTDQIQENIRARFQKHFFQITGEIDRLNSMVDTSIIISKIEAGKFPIRKSPTDIIKLTEQILIDNFETLNKDRPVKISHNGKPKLVELDERLITHILMNLISNAFKYSKGNPEINILFENDRLELEVKDDGIGIPLVEQNNLFEYFFRASNVAMHMGTGLGLIVVKEFMDLHNGIIEVKSEQNKGTSMRLIFPTVTKCIKY